MGCLGEEPNKKDPDIFIEKELERTDVKLIENAENIQGMTLDKPKPAKKNKWEFKKKNFISLAARQKIEININEIDGASIIDFKDNTYGINYKYKFIDVYDLENHNFLYRFKPIDECKILILYPLIDGTFLYLGQKAYIISILEKRAYHILYEVNMNFFELQLCDERIFCFSNGNAFMHEKDSNGIFKKKLEKKIPSTANYFIQVRDNILLARDSNVIYFIDANTLDITHTIDYTCWPIYTSNIGMITENLCVIKSKDIDRSFALIDINKKKIIEHYTQSEKERNERYRLNPELTHERSPILCSTTPLPNHSLFAYMEISSVNLKLISILSWDEEEQDFQESKFQFTDNENKRYITSIGVICDNGYVFLKAREKSFRNPKFKIFLLK